MPMFIILGRFTDEGVKDVSGWVAAFEQNRARGDALGLKLHDMYLTQGQYDYVVIVEAPDAESMLKQTFGVAGTGRGRSETLRAYTIDEVRGLLA